MIYATDALFKHVPFYRCCAVQAKSRINDMLKWSNLVKIGANSVRIDSFNDTWYTEHNGTTFWMMFQKIMQWNDLLLLMITFYRLHVCLQEKRAGRKAKYLFCLQAKYCRLSQKKVALKNDLSRINNKQLIIRMNLKSGCNHHNYHCLCHQQGFMYQALAHQMWL